MKLKLPLVVSVFLGSRGGWGWVRIRFNTIDISGNRQHKQHMDRYIRHAHQKGTVADIQNSNMHVQLLQMTCASQGYGSRHAKFTYAYTVATNDMRIKGVRQLTCEINICIHSCSKRHAHQMEQQIREINICMLQGSFGRGSRNQQL